MIILGDQVIILGDQMISSCDRKNFWEHLGDHFGRLFFINHAGRSVDHFGDRVIIFGDSVLILENRLIIFMIG